MKLEVIAAKINEAVKNGYRPYPDVLNAPKTRVSMAKLRIAAMHEEFLYMDSDDCRKPSWKLYFQEELMKKAS